MVALVNNNNSNTTKNEQLEILNNIIINLKLQITQQQQQQQQILNANDYYQQSKRKFKTIKIYLAYNKYEFDIESEFILIETRAELQQYFLEYGYNLQFIDINLNINYNPLIDAKLFKYLLKELDDCIQYSDSCVFILLLGDKYGHAPLPYEIEQAEFALIRSSAVESYLDVSLLDTWYQFDDQSNPPSYRLKLISDVFSNFYNRNKENYDSHQDEIDIWQNTYKSLLDVIQQSIENIKNKQPKGSSLANFDRYHLSYIEQITQAVLKQTHNECLVIERKFTGLNENSKNFEKYIDVKYDKVDKLKQDRLNKFRELIASKINETNIHRFNLNWNDEFIETNKNDNTRIESSESTTSIDFNKNEQLNNYLQSLNVILVEKIKRLVEDNLAQDLSYGLNAKQIEIIEEITRHLHYFNRISEQSLFGLDDSLDRFKKLISFSIKNEHYPIFICGNVGTGKTVSLTKFGSIAYSIIGHKNCLNFVIRYSELTAKSSSFECILYSICEQLALIQKINIKNEIKSKEISELTRFFNLICNQIVSKNSNKNLIILIDGINDVQMDKNLLNQNNDKLINDHLTWLFNKLPAKVHLIVSIRQHTSSNTSSSLTSMISYLYNEKIANSLNKENYLFELPFSIKSTDTKELTIYIKNEINKVGRYLNDDQVNIIIDNLGLKPIDATQPQIISLQSNTCLYLNLLLKTIGKCRSIKVLFSHFNGLKDIDSLIKYNIRNLENIFNYKIVYFIANYLNASHNGLTEIELIDVLSCNNEFFFEYYSHLNFPRCLRFPQLLWIYFKNEFDLFLIKKYNDNQLTLTWKYECIKKIMKQTYFNKVENVRVFHKDLANYFLESFVETKPLIDMNKNIQLRDEDGKRYISQQPLTYSNLLYNYRRLNESWYHFMNSGDIQRLKEDAFYNFEYLLARVHGTSLLNLLNDMELVLKRILDIDIYLLYSLLKKSLITLIQDPLRLASEILSSIRPLQDEYGQHVKHLVAQAMHWCENYSSPVLIPLSAWLESPESLLITKINCQDGIHKLAITSFNQHVFLSTIKNEILMYHVPSKKLVKKFTGHTKEITSLRISHNNRFLISTSIDNLVKVWNLGTGEIDHVFTCNKSSVLSCVISHNDEFIITGSEDKLINIIRINTGEILNVFDKHESAITALALSNCDTILVSASLDKTVKRWCLTDMELKDNITSFTSPVTKMVITYDNTFIITACENFSIHVKSLITGTHIHELSSHTSQVNNLAVSSDCERLFVGCADSKLYLYNFKTSQLLSIIIDQDTGINDLAISIDNSFLFSSSGNSLYVINLKKPINNTKEQDTYENSLKQISCFDISQQGDLALTGDDYGRIMLWNLVDGILGETIMTHDKEATCVNLSKSYLFSVSASKDFTVKVFDNEQHEKVTEFKEHKAPIRYLMILEGNERILSADEDNCIKVWYADTGQLIDSLSVACQILCCSPDSKYVVSGSGDNALKVWLLNDAKVVRQIDHPNKITHVLFSHDSNFIITGGEDNSCKIWESSTGKLIQVLIEHENAITSIAVSSTNTYVVTGSKDKHVLLWNFKDGNVINRMSLHKDEIVKVALTLDSSVIFSASRDGIINVWSTIGGHLLSGIDLHCGIHDILIALNGSRLIVRLINSSSIPILQFNNKSIQNINVSTLSQMNLKISDTLRTANQYLPIKQKPLLFQKQKTVFKMLSNQQLDRNQNEAISSAEETTQIISINSNQQNNSHGIRDFFRKKRIKHERKSGDFSSSVNITKTASTKQKKTKICCLL